MLFYTVCNINQLAEACVLGDSIKAQNAAYKYMIGLVADKSILPSSEAIPYEVISITEIGIENFSEFCQKYTHEEVLKNSKPFFCSIFIQQNPKRRVYCFFDTYTLVFNQLDFIADSLKGNNIILAPQIVHANKHPDEKIVLNSGIFHAGFFALKRSKETFCFLNWWQNNVAQKGFVNLCKGMNAEQLWLEHVPIFFENIHIEKHDGLNVGTWNLAERNVNFSDNLVNDSPLISFNFEHRQNTPLYSNKTRNYPEVWRKISPKYGKFVRLRKPNIVSKTLFKMADAIDKLMDSFV